MCRLLLLFLFLLPSLALAQQENLRGQVVSIDASNAVNICSGTGDIRIATNCTGGGTQYTWVFDASTGQLSTTTGVFLVGDGAVGAPSFSFASDTDTGVYYTTNSLNFATSGVKRADLSSVGLDLAVPLRAESSLEIKATTSDGSDNQYTFVCSGGACSDTRGGIIQLYGNEEATNAGDVTIASGNVAGSQIGFATPSGGAATAIYFSPYGINSAGYWDSDGNLTFSLGRNVRRTVGTVIASGSAQGDAAAISSQWQRVNSASGTNGVRLVELPVGESQYVFNNSASGLLLYPQTGGSINGGSANAAVTVGANGSAHCGQITSTVWFCLGDVS